MRTFLSLAGTTALAAGLATVPAAAVATTPVSVAATPVACDSGQLATAVATAPTGSTLDLAPGCLYTLTTPYSTTTALPPVDRTLVINGNGATIARTGSGPSRIFEVTSTGHLTLNDLTIRTETTTAGSPQSGASGTIHAEGGLVLHNVTIISSTSSGNGILVVGSGTTTVANGSTVTGSGNLATEVSTGSGTIDVDASVPDVDTTVNVPGVSVVGIGGIKHAGALHLSLSSVLTGSSSTAGSGGVHNSVTVINSSSGVVGTSAVACAGIPGPVPGCSV